ncbi:wax ester synthase-like acyl-CoA acyltransferase family protein [Propionicimonas paludicola]|uniref:Wax ester synthase-like acyl-CoA acyltransferase family protein n=1 Tax=Propionicimonas paludicola TaxID=185243 RepID=A0A2A9CUK8_9ACTN|nr:WS/DGAT domain-containing protein [Propionicimonas paludicola]PFG18078.1 wax ester synthase-like acyl-CoA acyltransferase family protein [Propionicimonas paludicola]
MERFSLGDAAELAGDVGPDPRLIGVVAELDRPIELDALRALIAERLPDQPILARRVVRDGPATWKACWETVELRVEDHVYEVPTSDPLRTATDLVSTDFGHRVPAWRLILLRGPQTSALLFAAHHVLLDGATAVGVVGSLLGADLTVPMPPARRRRFLGFLGLLAGANAGVAKTSLLTPITAGFRLATVDAPLAPVQAAARRCGATVNDALLLAAAEALRAVAAARGEQLGRVVFSVPVTGQAHPGRQVGRNEVAAMAVAIPDPAGRDDAAQLVRIAGRTRWRKLLAHGFPSAGAFAGVLALLGRLGWYRPLFSRQRAITSLLTNLRGPAEPLNLLGAEVTSLTALSPALGNVTVVFAAVSYAGTLRITARLDRSVWPEQDVLTSTLANSLDRLAGSAGSPQRTRTR